MSEESEPERFLFSTLEGLERNREEVRFQPEGKEGSPRGGAGQRHRKVNSHKKGGGVRDGAELDPDPESGSGRDGSGGSSSRGHADRKRPRPAPREDVEMGGGSGSSGTESHGSRSVGGSSGNGKDSGLLGSTGSNKSLSSPPSSSNAFSLVSCEQDNPSTSGCSSELSAKAKTQEELFKTLRELKVQQTTEKRSKGRPSTVNALKYALRCVKQVKANEEYYQMLKINDSQPPGFDVSSYTIEEINSITSEYTLKNNDIFAAAVSLVTGEIVYISDQAASILNCKREVFKDAKFVEFLTPQDVSVFYSSTTPCRLPPWSMCTGAESSPTECMQEKSFFCRISGGKQRAGHMQYYPFRMTPYLMKVQDAELGEEQFCCLLLAERVHSGYEAPRIPTDKRIFTTTHTPNCVFQHVDERAVPLLGYLPQDLIGTPVLLSLHPSDRPLMLAVHRKILQYVGRPFDHSSVRVCARNGEYVTIDTSWSSFVNPWSRKVSFVIGRHKVRMGPVNEDVFAAPAFHGGKIVDSDIQEMSEKIHRLLLQPVHHLGSSGYGSNGSREPLVSISSSGESGANAAREADKAKPPRTFQEICKGVHMLKNQDSQGDLRSPPPSPPPPPPSKPEQRKSAGPHKSPVMLLKDSAPPLLVRDSTAASVADQTLCSYQQISCLDSVIRYLDSCNTPITAKRKYQFSNNTASSNSDDDKKGSEDCVQVSRDASQEPSMLEAQPQKPSAGTAGVAGATVAPLALASKAESVVSVTSQCSYSSTIVHVGDKKPRPESEIIVDVTEGPAPPALQEEAAYKRLGLTKQVLAAHTQKEEQAFLHSARSLRKDAFTHLHRQRGPADAEGTRGATKGGAKRGSRNRKSKKPRMKHPDSSDSAASNRKPWPPLQGLNQTSWSPSEASQSAFNVSYPAVVPAHPLYPPAPAASAQAPCPDPSLATGFGEAQSSRAPPTAAPLGAPVVTPVVALVLPNYLFPQIGQLGPMGPLGAAPRPAFYPDQGQTQPAYAAQQALQPPQPAFATPTQPPYAAQPPFPVQTAFSPQTLFSTPQPFQTPQTLLSAPHAFPAPQAAYAPQPSFPLQNQFWTRASYPAQPPPHGLGAGPPKSTLELGEAAAAAASRSSTPASGAPEPTTPLFESRCSSPLQLNLLSMEEGQRQDGSASAAVPGAAGEEVGNRQQVESPGDGAQSDCNSSSCDLLDVLLQEDSRSASSDSTGCRSRSGCNGSRTSASGASGSGTGSSNTSKYFGSIDSLDPVASPVIKYLLQKPLWLVMANADEKVMMTYQMPPRDIQRVLREDKERLRQMQKSQPHFSSDQRQELMEEHPWMRRGGLPAAINVKECVYCEDAAPAPAEEKLPHMDMGELGQELSRKGQNALSQSEESRPRPDAGS
ncbi:period circadian protein homolog 2-like [Pungitius pungitius]|uniref:period circadian protein homolog 2-like n=1 Tax=Pungitius pungitius TaxID=134920 RepID=UPI002E0D45C3